MPSSQRIELIGGPLDGETIPKHPGKYAWVGARMLALRTSFLGRRDAALEARGSGSAPTDGRALYELGGGGDFYHYAGHRKTLCDCGSYHPKREGGSERAVCPLARKPERSS